MTTIDTTAAPTVILNDGTAPSTEASETEAKFNAIVGYTPIDYPALTDLEVLDGLVSGATKTIRDRHWAEFDKRVRPVVAATARKLMADNPNDHDDAVNFAIAKVMDLHEHKKVVNAVRRGEKLANCIAAFVRQDSTQAAVDKGRHINAAGGKTTTAAPKEERKLITVDFTADETLRSIDGNVYTMDPLDDALDRELHGVPTDGEIAAEWFEQVLSAHNVHLTQRELDVLFHSAGITPDVTDYLDGLAASEPADAARAIGAFESNPRTAAKRAGAPRLPQKHVATILNTSQYTVSTAVDSAENAIFASPALVREARRGSDELRRVVFEDIADHCANWLLDNYAQANMFPTEVAVRAIPDTAWRTTMDEFGYDTEDYTADDISDIIEVVIAYIPRNAHQRIIRHLIGWMKGRVTNRKPTEDQVLATTHLWQERVFNEFAYDLDEVSAEELERITSAVVRGAKK